jgi:hypothetical protein
MRAHIASLILLVIAVPVQSQAPTTAVSRSREAVLTRPGGVDRGAVLDRGTFGTPSITQATPNTAPQGQQNVTVQLTGSFTNFTAGATVASFGPGVTLAGPLTVASPTTATAVLLIDPWAATGARTVTLTTGQEVATAVNGFTVTPRPDGFSNTCVSPSNLGQLYPGASKQATGQLYAANTEEWFYVTFSPGSGLTLSLKNVQPSSDFDMDVRSACAAPQLASTSAGQKTLVLPDNGPHTVYIRLRASQWDVAHPGFTMTLAAN